MLLTNENPSSSTVSVLFAFTMVSAPKRGLNAKTSFPVPPTRSVHDRFRLNEMKITSVKAGRRDIHQSNRIVRVERNDCISSYQRCMTLHGSEIREQRVNTNVSLPPLPVIMLWKFEPGELRVNVSLKFEPTILLTPPLIVSAPTLSRYCSRAATVQRC